jgi:hypothetical protein
MFKLNRQIITGLGLMLAAVAGASAQDASGEVFGGYSYVKASTLVAAPKTNMHGWMGGAAAYVNRWFGVGMEIGANFGDIPAPSGVTAPNLSSKQYSYLVGPQFRFVRTHRVQVAAKFLLGAAFGQVRVGEGTSADAAAKLSAAGYSSFDQTKFAMLLGFPVDASISQHVGIRFEPGLYMTDFSKTKASNFRFSVGPVFRFGGK